MAPLKLKKLLWLLAGIVTGVLLSNWGSLLLTERLSRALGAIDLSSFGSVTVARKQVDFVDDPAYGALTKDFKFFSGKELQDDFRYVSEADFLRDTVRLFCFTVFTERNGGEFEAIASTWAPLCNGFAIYSFNTFGHANGVPIVQGRNDTAGHLLRHLIANFASNHTWFVFVPAKTYLMAENLRRVLAVEDHAKPLVLGSTEHSWSFLSSSTLTAPTIFSKAVLSSLAAAAEAWTTAQCLKKPAPGGLTCAARSLSGAAFVEPYDQSGCSLFLPLPVGMFQFARHNSIVWFDEITKTTCCPQFPISFSTLDATKLYDLHWFTHHLKVYGRRSTVGGRIRIVA